MIIQIFFYNYPIVCHYEQHDLAKSSNAKSVAKAFNRNLQSAIETLINNPNKGRLNEDGYRELVHKGYTVPYLIDDEIILILGIFNQNEWKQK